MKVIFDSTHRLLQPSKIDSMRGFLAMHTFDHDKREIKTLTFASQNRNGLAEWSLKLIKEMRGATMRCHPCHRFKTTLCGDTISCTHISSTSLITGADNMQDPALTITTEDDFLSMVS
jgi:hypothetical protein